jgi:hypothetical protein
MFYILRAKKIPVKKLVKGFTFNNPKPPQTLPRLSIIPPQWIDKFGT